MNLIEIDDHLVDIDLLPEKAIILDGGCRGFKFTDYFTDLGHTVYSVDIDELVDNKYIRCALSHESGTCAVVHTHDPQAKHIKEGDEIFKYTIDDFKKRYEIPYFDLVKLDIEGAEFDILKTAQHPMAKSLSIEFHAHCDSRQTKQALDELITHLSQWYTVHNQVWESRYGCVENYWSILFIAK